ncbi:MAG: hypothetical protein ACREQF_01405, partial [Candidatus Binataceae bacterium]
VEDGAEWSTPEQRRVTVLVWRSNGHANFRDVDAFERGALLTARAGAPFAEICESAAAVDLSVDAAPTIASMLPRWLADGLIVTA